MSSGEPANIGVLPERGRENWDARRCAKLPRHARLRAGGKDLRLDQQRDLDSGGDAPAFLGCEAESLEGVRQGLAQAQTVEEIECGALRVLGIDGFGEQFEDGPGQHRSPHGGGHQLRAVAGKDAAGGGGPGFGKEALQGGNPHGSPRAARGISQSMAAGLVKSRGREPSLWPR